MIITIEKGAKNKIHVPSLKIAEFINNSIYLGVNGKINGLTDKQINEIENKLSGSETFDLTFDETFK